jgi:adenylosuccinate synthase
MKVDVLLGLQWGDEGKGKIVDVLTPKYDIIARFQGGPNAGHTLEFNGIKHVLHTIPSGVFRKDTKNVIGNGVVIDPIIFKREILALAPFGVDIKNSILVSRKAHLIIPSHRLLDMASENAKGKLKIGSTLKGIGPTYMDKTGRNGIRVGDILKPNFKEIYQNLADKHKRILDQHQLEYNLESLEPEFFECIDFLRSMNIIDSAHYLNNEMNAGKRILAEGAQGSLLDIDFGTYPFVTSSNTLCSGACSGLGIAPNRINEVYGIFKAYCTRVGSGPFPTELQDETGEAMRKSGNEFGSTTGRPRRCGWIDIPALKYAIMVNGVTQLFMMKADVLSIFDTIKVCTAYRIDGQEIDYFPYDVNIDNLEPVYVELPGWKNDLTQLGGWNEMPDALNEYVSFLESKLNVPITIVSVGPDRTQTLMRSAVSA